ncbi:MAG: aquaporin [Bacteroidota bacterium]|nr:aquaporin [Bacteroidota bacterium]
MAVIHSTGFISGAHINPAVSIAFCISKRFKANKVIPYILSQFSGAICASLLLSVMFPQHDLLGASLPAGSWEQSFVMEFMLSFILMFVILFMSEGSKEVKTMTGFVLGMVVAFGAIFAGPVSGASMNPARSMAPALVSGYFSHLWF